MLGMILMTVVQIAINLVINTVSYGLMAYVVVYAARKAWKGK